MIDAHAVVAHLEKLGDLKAGSPAGNVSQTAWLDGELQQTALQHDRDGAGNVWLTLPGSDARSVVLGTYLEGSAGSDPLDTHLGMVASLETLKAIARRADGPLPCTLHVAVWAQPAAANQAAALRERNAAAYLELHAEPSADLQAQEPALGMASATDALPFHPRLTTLGDEAVQEMTGASATATVANAQGAAELARLGIPAAVMYVQSPAKAGGQKTAGERVHLLQAAEAFGRWTESTLHLLAGDPVDLWAREHRVPRT
ncbi:MAG: hypothetical protein ACRYGF_14065 [Janthinobacterium lividum]